jgi:hypothetical protein
LISANGSAPLSNTLAGVVWSKATIPGGSNKQPMMRLGITRPSRGRDSPRDHHEAAFAVRIAGFPARRQKFPCCRIQGNTPRRTPRRGRTGESGPTRKPVPGEFPVFSLWIRDFGQRDGFAIDGTHRHSIRGCGDSAPGSPTIPEYPVLSRGLGRGAQPNPNRRRRAPGR